MVILITRERLTGGSPWPGPVTVISIIIRRRVRIWRSPSPLLVAQPPSQAVNLQLHTSSILFMEEVTPTSRITSTSMHGMHANLLVPSSLKIEELVLALGTNRLLPVWPWTHHSWTLNSPKLKFPTDGSNCKGRFWIPNPKGKRIKAQRAQYKEFVESGLKTRLQWIGQHLQWTKDGKKVRKREIKTSFCKEILPRQSLRRVVLEYISLRLDYNCSHS